MEQMRPEPIILPRLRRGFSLLELLVVIAILALLLGICIPAFTSISQGAALAQGGQKVADALVLGRQDALLKNRKVSVRLIKVADAVGGGKHYRAVQTWQIKDDAGTTVPLTKVSTFPNGIILTEKPELSPLLQSPPAQAGTMMVSGASCDYVSFALLANGSLDSSISNQAAFLTLVREKDADVSLPANYLSICINPVTGEVTTFQP